MISKRLCSHNAPQYSKAQYLDISDQATEIVIQMFNCNCLLATKISSNAN